MPLAPLNRFHQRGSNLRAGFRRSIGARLFLAVFLIAQSFLCRQARAQNVAFASFNEPPRAVSAATAEGRRALFGEIWRTIAARYYDPLLRHLDWWQIRARVFPLAQNARNEREFYDVMRRMIDLLDDPHTRLYAPDEKNDWSHPTFISVGISVREIENQIIVTRVAPNSDAERAGLRAGSRIIALDGADAQEILARRASANLNPSDSAMASQKNDGDFALRKRRRLIAQLFDGAPDSLVTVQFAAPDERPRTVTLHRARAAAETKVNAHFLDHRKTIALIGFNLFTRETTNDLARLVRDELKHAHAVILDLRSNGGGDAEAMTDAASIFLPENMRLGFFTDREGRIAAELQTRRRLLFSAEELKRFRGALVVLTSERTASAAEIFTAALRDNRRAVIIGEPTCGCVLGVRRRYTLADGGALDISEMDFHTARGARLEGAGIAPDVTIIPTREDLVKRRDESLEHALEFLKREKNW
jgi:carboxyl-terminal processing protease